MEVDISIMYPLFSIID